MNYKLVIFCCFIFALAVFCKKQYPHDLAWSGGGERPYYMPTEEALREYSSLAHKGRKPFTMQWVDDMQALLDFEKDGQIELVSEEAFLTRLGKPDFVGTLDEIFECVNQQPWELGVMDELRAGHSSNEPVTNRESFVFSCWWNYRNRDASGEIRLYMLDHTARQKLKA